MAPSGRGSILGGRRIFKRRLAASVGWNVYLLVLFAFAARIAFLLIGKRKIAFFLCIRFGAGLRRFLLPFTP